MIIPINAENASDKIQHPFMIKKNLKNVSTERTNLNIIKAIYDKHTIHHTHHNQQ